MATERLKAILEAAWTGGKATADASMAIAGVGKASETAKGRMERFKDGAATVGKGLGVLVGGAKIAWNVLEQGASLNLARDRFERLSASIGTTADAMLTDMRAATQGLQSDAQLMAGATQIINLGLMDSSEGVIRLSRLIGSLGWDMNQIIPTFANNSILRLDALGLSVSDVTERTKAFQATGMEYGEAFNWAIIEAGEAQIERMGRTSDSAAGDMRKLKADVDNLKNSLLEFVAAQSAPAFAAMSNRYGKQIDKMIAANRQAADSMEDLIDLAQRVNEQQGFGAFLTGTASELKAASVDLTRDIAALSGGVDEFVENMQRAFGDDTYIKGLDLHTGSVGELTAAYTELTRTALTEYVYALEDLAQMGRDAAQATNEQAAATDWNRLETERAMLSTTSYVYTLEELAQMGREGVDTLNLQTGALEDVDEALRIADEAARALAKTFASEFKTALDAGSEGSVNLRMELLEQGVAAGVTGDALYALALQTGEFTAAEIEAALKAAAMRKAIALVAEEIANGNIDVKTGTELLQDYEAQLEQGYKVEIDTQDILDAQAEAEELERALLRAAGSYTAVFNIEVRGGLPSPVEGADGPIFTGRGDYAYAHGTGGWQTVPGPAGAPFPVTLHGGEQFNVVPVGQQAEAGGGDTYNYYIYPTYAEPTSEMSLTQDITAMELLRS